MLIGRSNSPVLRLAFTLFAAVALCAPASAMQHLIRPGDDWQLAASRLRPGDEIILMPGQHRNASIDQARGTAERPIIIRGADPTDPPIIIAQREGIRIRYASHIVIKDLCITGATINGITIGNLSNVGQDTDPANEDVIIRNVSIARTGPRGQRHGIMARRTDGLRIEDCRFEGWGGSGVELIACNNAMVSRCSFKGLSDFSQVSGIRARAGCTQVEIEACRFDNAGAFSICLGMSSNLEDFQTSALNAAGEGAMTEVVHGRVQNCLFIGSQCAVALSNADECSIRNNTIVRPRRCVLALLSEQRDPRFSPGKASVLGRNLIVWDAGDLQRLVDLNPRIDASKFVLDANLWWSSEDAASRAKLGGIPGKELAPQVTDVDPQLDADFKPQEPLAADFGVGI